MFMSDRLNRINATIDNYIHVWSSSPHLVPLAEILQNDRDIVAAKLLRLGVRGVPEGRDRRDAVRLFLIGYVLQRIAVRITPEHFTIFRDAETVQVVLEDSYGFEFQADRDDILIPHQNEALKILIHCLFHRSKPADQKDVLSFLHLFSRDKANLSADQDRTMRLRSMIWFIYLAIEIAKTDEMVRVKGVEYFRNKFRELLDRTIEGAIIDEESRLPGFEGGKWERTLFGWLQGEDRKPFLEKLKRQFNMENRIEHANRCLLAEHRKCVLEQVLAVFGG
ncbi:MAG TPA: hypothetical protein VEF34_02790 [Syntrophobacteraceae bacterium]|nr:hypothetical protein [Syntrophobacteraceae bacterium]